MSHTLGKRINEAASGTHVEPRPFGAPPLPAMIMHVGIAEGA